MIEPHEPEPIAISRPLSGRLPEMRTPQEIALSFARTPLAGAQPRMPAGLPQPLAPSEAARLRRIFDLQARGDMAQAAREAERLEDRRLMGHVLADRWRPGGVEPTVAELRAWLAEHADYADAPRLHALLVARLPKGAEVPPLPGEPAAEAVPAPGQEVPPEEREPPAAARAPLARNPALDRTVREMAGRGEMAEALRHIAGTRGITPAYAAALQTDVASALFTSGKDAEAFRVASLAARAAGAPAQASYLAGLSAWGLGQYEAALPFFESAARNEAAPAVLRSAAAFWTARAAVRSRRPQGYVPWMLQAAQEPRTFYGLVARRALGLPPGFAWESDVAGEAEGAVLAETAGGWRALALIQVGQKARAEAELRRLWSVAQGNPALARGMLAAATAAGMPELSTMLASQAQAADGRPRDYARFPVPRLEPQGGWRADPALIYGLARQESNFDPDAVSPAGARGLMQVMPATAAYITGDAALRDGSSRRLHDPGYSLELGQRYLLQLSGQENVQGNLIRLLAAYNAGPGNLSRWMPANGHREDPFLFIESIPFNETRAYVQRVLAYSWIYASRLGLPSPSLDALAAGSTPRFLGVDELARMVARGRGS
ncbi:lytic transglycosylase domain-containing protein [Roseomonas nepalensis]|uniref:Lytic transglycosylase domain-containing protein n=2 Tax=Muricoccus nepalensis TaxID=1854500 RepID=A0A502G5V5_9PROT|nr:lytic transglycosylase domain-containing protein [Roseomonas nepalensis]